MNHVAYQQRRSEIAHYFDRTAAAAWARLTSKEPLGRIRASVRQGRSQMQATLLSWLPSDMTGLRLLDAGCGTGLLACEAASRGAEVVAIDLSPTLVELAQNRLQQEQPHLVSRVQFHSGDMLDDSLGEFDHVVAMDSLIHYSCEDIARAVAHLSRRTKSSLVFTFAPRTPALALMHRVGRLFPRTDRSPALEPVARDALERSLQDKLNAQAWKPGRCERIAHGFYTSQAWEWSR